MTLTEAYVQACGTPSDINEHLQHFVNICAELDAKKVIELGTRGGVSTVGWLYALEQTGGHLWSVDIDPAPELPYEHWTFVQGDDMTPDVYQALPDEVDVLFIDTSHMYAHTLAELNSYVWKVRKGGRIVLHDTDLAHPEGWTRAQPPYPVRQAVVEFCAEELLEHQFLGPWPGLGIITIPE